MITDVGESEHELAAPEVMVRAEALYLRHFTPGDQEPIYRLSQEHGMRAWLPDQVYRDEAQALEVLRYLISHYGPTADPRHTPYVLAVCLATSRELIGHVGFSPCEYGVEIGYAIGDAHQNRGYAKQAVQAASTWAQERFTLPSIHAVVAADNLGSCKVLESCGYQMVTVVQRKLHGVERSVRVYQLSNAASSSGQEGHRAR